MFNHNTVELKKSKIHYVTCGTGVPVVLLHGWPQTWYCWKNFMQLIPEGFQLIAPDLPGLGDSLSYDRQFDKKNLASSIDELIDYLNIDAYHLVGHDWGGAVAWALNAHYSGKQKSLTLIDIAIPGDGNPNISQNGARWHHGFHKTPELPEELISGREHIYLKWFYDNYGNNKEVFHDEDIKEYLRSYSKRENLNAGFELYRAFDTDRKDNEERARTFKPTTPVFAIGGGSSWGRGEEVIASARRLADNVKGFVVETAGHWVPEEAPQELVKQLVPFWSSHQ
ncbi:alpha/beta hydrolase [Klebsiella pneumoniae]|uniref:alpha/beta fold hydrolase n=1 Tax=Klebsiella pneumoniae TaxID=573 RepID=UPI001BA5DDB1|nr:alpha/beta hydrolase [Klebsiella pneumoniae]MBQ5265177.1 alpha/beta hydrolase [Klebsiella pneumoniae]